MHLFYQPIMSDGAAFLSEEESKHCVKVLRLQAKDEVFVVDGKGGFYRCEITKPDARRCEVRVLEKKTDYGKRPYSIHIAIAPTKNSDRMEWFVEKCVELGIDEISFIICEHSERRFFKTDRLEKIAIGAMKQSLKAFLPIINEAESYHCFLQRTSTAKIAASADFKFIAYIDAAITAGNRQLLQAVAEPKGRYCVLIGPEGDFSAKEVSLALDQEFRPVSLGESRLRTETAGMVACHLLHVIHSNETN
ncbi:MAG: 16S rRNA (uracil(1498)-N(3))-methyltransferase [Bacteroidota bacterium]